MSENIMDGEYSKIRHFFEDNSRFENVDSFPEDILDAYEVASRMTTKSARFAIRSNKMSDIRTAQWHEAVAKTLENVMCMLERGDAGEDGLYEASEFEYPDPPEFESDM